MLHVSHCKEDIILTAILHFNSKFSIEKNVEGLIRAGQAEMRKQKKEKAVLCLTAGIEMRLW